MNIVAAVAIIRPTIVGCIPLRTLLTPAYLSRFFISAAIISIIRNEGRTTPRVAVSAPKIPA